MCLANWVIRELEVKVCNRDAAKSLLGVDRSIRTGLSRDVQPSIKQKCSVLRITTVEIWSINTKS